MTENHAEKEKDCDPRIRETMFNICLQILSTSSPHSQGDSVWDKVGRNYHTGFKNEGWREPVSALFNNFNTWKSIGNEYVK